MNHNAVQSDVPGFPWGFSAIQEEEGTLNRASVNNGYFIQSNPNAIFVLDSDLIGVSVLNLCPAFEPAVRYLDKHGYFSGTADIPTTNKVPRSILAARWSGDGYGYDATPPASPAPPSATEYGIPGDPGGETTTPPTTVPPTSGDTAYGGPPPGDGAPWQPAPPALVADVDKLYSTFLTGGLKVTQVYISQDRNSPQWYFVYAFVPMPPTAMDNASGAGIEELVNGTWVMVSGVDNQAPGCFGPEDQELPSGTSDVPANILSDFAQSCS